MVEVREVIHHHNMDQQVVHLDDDHKDYKRKIDQILLQRNVLTDLGHNYPLEYAEVYHDNDVLLVVHHY